MVLLPVLLDGSENSNNDVSGLFCQFGNFLVYNRLDDSIYSIN
jgi:hypothetical protein